MHNKLYVGMKFRGNPTSVRPYMMPVGRVMLKARGELLIGTAK
jgi:hypothetical protein